MSMRFNEVVWSLLFSLVVVLASDSFLLDREQELEQVVPWETLVVGQMVEFTLPGGWWHEGVFEEGGLPMMKSGDAKYLAYVAKVEPTEGVWLSTVVTNGPPVSYGNVLTIPLPSVGSVDFDVLQSAP